MIFKVDLNLNVWLVELEIEAESKEAAQAELSRMVVQDPEELLRAGIVKNVTTSNEDWTLVEKRVTAHVTDIEYDVSEEDAEYNNMTVEQIIDTLPKEADVTFTMRANDDMDDEVADAISGETSWLVKSFKYEVIKEA